MSQPADLPLMSPEEFLAFEEAASQKHAYVAGRVYPWGDADQATGLAGASRRHNRLAARIIARLSPAADAAGCDIFGSDMLLRTPADVFYYPDLQVVCDPTDQLDRYTERPCVLVEILSERTKNVDRRAKLLVYRTLPSLQSYLIFAHDEPRCERHWRDPAGDWHIELIGEGGSTPFPCLGVSLTLLDICGTSAS
jgi:Uma2 family endonuclease